LSLLNRLLKAADSEEACALASESTFAPARSRLAIEWWCIVGILYVELVVFCEAVVLGCDVRSENDRGAYVSQEPGNIFNYIFLSAIASLIHTLHFASQAFPSTPGAHSGRRRSIHAKDSLVKRCVAS
jgi:hypothetical protein